MNSNFARNVYFNVRQSSFSVIKTFLFQEDFLLLFSNFKNLMENQLSYGMYTYLCILLKNVLSSV